MAYPPGSEAGSFGDGLLPIGMLGLGTDAPPGYWLVPPDPTCHAESSTFLGSHPDPSASRPFGSVIIPDPPDP